MPEERCSGLEVSGTLRVRRSKEITKLNASSHEGLKYLLKEMMTFEVPYNKEICGKRRIEGEKKSVFFVHQRRANRRRVYFEERNGCGLFSEMLTPSYSG